jgi:predicted benzoate:H+ symporter BenE
VASSEMTLLGFGPVFWALVVGMGVTLLLETEALADLQTGT